MQIDPPRSSPTAEGGSPGTSAGYLGQTSDRGFRGGIRFGSRLDIGDDVSADWADLYRTTLPELVGFLHRRVWDLERAKDLAQETFVRALREQPEKPRAWLFAVAANLARDEARAAIRWRRHITLLKSEAAVAARVPDPRGELERGEREVQVRRALEVLGERDREALLLWDAGQNYEEIAAALGLAVGAVGTTLARARQRLVRAHRELEKADVARR